MRTSNITAEEIQAAEKASEDRRRSRSQGFDKMHERDRAYQQLSNGTTMLWHVNKELIKQEGTTEVGGKVVDVKIYPPTIPEDSFALVIEGKTHLFNLDEFRRWLRWA